MNKTLSILITFILLFVCETCWSQKLVLGDSTNYYIDRLNENSYNLVSDGTYAPKIRIYLNDDAREIIKIHDKNKLKKLLNKIRDPEKTFSIDFILKELIEPQNNNQTGCYIKMPKLPNSASTDSLLKYPDSDPYKNVYKIPDKDYINCIYEYWEKRIGILDKK